MERRSTRGRTSSLSEHTSKNAPVAAVVEVATAVHVPAPDVPDIAGEEVVLNRRGMPARQRKRNRFYFDDDNMITTDTSSKRNASRSPGKKVKPEPQEEEEAEVITSDLPDYGFGHEVEIPQSPPREPTPPLPPPPKSSGRGKSSSKAAKAAAAAAEAAAASSPSNVRTYSRRSDVEPTTPKGKSRRDKERERQQREQEREAVASILPPKPTQKSQAESAPKSRGRSESSKKKEKDLPKETPSSSKPPRAEPSSSRESKKSAAARAESASTPRGGKRRESVDSRSRSVDNAPIKSITKIKKEPGSEVGSSSGQKDTLSEKYLEKREKDRLAKERERKREKERQLKEREREREYNSLMPVKSRGKRDPSPNLGNSDFSGMIPQATGQDELKQAIDKKTAQDISLRLRNLLKLPKAHKWVCYEWFYSNIDKVLFEGENDFQICLKESFPQMKARKLTRVEWCKIRRLMGKPRRCSQAFFDEEREELGRRRQKIRMIQQRKITDFNYKELPDEIPLQLTIGTKVTARLRRPQDGLFTGTIEGVDTSNNTYRITFDRAGLGTHSIPDYEVLSNDPVETVSTSSFALKIPRRSFGFGTAAFKFQNPGLIGEDGIYRFPTSPFPVDGMLGGFPIRLLDMIVRLSKLLKAKREKILQLKELNVEAEKMRSYGKSFNGDYRIRYARCVLDLDSMNKEMAMYVEGIQTYCLEQIAPDHGANQMIVPEQVQEQCRQEANLIVDTYNTKQNRRSVHGGKSLGLISQLTSLMLQVKTLSNGERNLYELKSIKETIKETKASLEGKNLQLFQNRVEIPMNRIQAGLCMSTKPY